MSTKKKILIGEDERPMAKALELKLNSVGFEAKAVFNGNEVIEELTTNKYDLLLLDLIMPKLGGLEVIREAGKEQNIIVVSAVGQDNVVKEAKDLGAKGYIVKPFDNKQVIEEINKVLG
jgi:DNA-binding response OmpR family regulator